MTPTANILQTVDKLEKLFNENNVNAEFVRYKDVGHAFMNRDRPSVYSADLAAQARAKSADFLKKHTA